MRVRLLIGPSAAALHGVRWETMRDPDDGSPLLTDEAIVFSRYLSSLDWRPVGLRAEERAAGAGRRGRPHRRRRSSAPTGSWRRSTWPRRSERARDGLAPLPTRVLAEHGEATLERLFDELREGCDILYLVCHGYLAARDEPILLLEDETGSGAPVRAIELVERIRDLAGRPGSWSWRPARAAGRRRRATATTAGVLAALGPRLAEAGVPAVRRHAGQRLDGDRRRGSCPCSSASSSGTARSTGRWRRRAGRSATGTTGGCRCCSCGCAAGASGTRPASAGPADFEKFPALVNEIRKRTLHARPRARPQRPAARLAPGDRAALGEELPLPDGAARARRPAAGRAVPLGEPEPRVPARRARQLPARGAGRPTTATSCPRSYRDQQPEDIAAGPADVDAWRSRYPQGADDPYAVLAELPMSLYVTTQPWNLLAEALRDGGQGPPGRDVPVEATRRAATLGRRPGGGPPDWAFRWRTTRTSARRPRRPDGRHRSSTANAAYRPSDDRPLVYHLFGHHARPRSLVLTEDDYFDFLIGVTRDKDLVPVGVRRAFADSSLMFLGFRLDEWDFRVLFRSIVNQEGDRRSEHTHVAVQIDPEEGRSMEPERARRYLESYFQSSNVTIYWGSTESFLKELRDAWAQRAMTTTARAHTNPYVGPQSFRRGDALYGRDREVADLLDLLIAERVVLLHSPSGAGKTSLIQARLLPAARGRRVRGAARHPPQPRGARRAGRPRPAGQPVRAQRPAVPGGGRARCTCSARCRSSPD